MSPKIRPWKRFRPNSLTKQWSLVCLETFSETGNQSACNKLILIVLFMPIDVGHYPKAYLATMAISTKDLFVSSQVTFHNMTLWIQTTNFFGCGAKEWQGIEHGRREQGSWVSVYFPGYQPRNNCMFPKKHSLSMRRDSKTTANSGSSIPLQLALTPGTDWEG